jgi:hypothetical protein
MSLQGTDIERIKLQSFCVEYKAHVTDNLGLMAAVISNLLLLRKLAGQYLA